MPIPPATSASVLDIPALIFLTLRDLLFDAQGKPVAFSAVQTGNLQGDWLDTHLTNCLEQALRPRGYEIEKSGKNTSPDFAVFRSVLVNQPINKATAVSLADVTAFEVKKLQSTGSKTNRAGGDVDYNSTPPCGLVLVYDQSGTHAFTVRGFYVFLVVDPVIGQSGYFAASSLVVCDGNALNADHDLYLRVVAPRTKEIGLGTYGDGAIRNRPFVLFPHPLSVPWLLGAATLVHPDSHIPVSMGLTQVSMIERKNMTTALTVPFYCYQTDADAQRFKGPTQEINPFKTPSRRRDGSRGKLRLRLKPEAAAVELVVTETDVTTGPLEQTIREALED